MFRNRWPPAASRALRAASALGRVVREDKLMADNEVFAAQRVQEVLAFIDQHLGERLTLPAMAQVLAINSYHFAHVFKQATGLAPHQYVIQRRLVRAKELL